MFCSHLVWKSCPVVEISSCLCLTRAFHLKEKKISFLFFIFSLLSLLKMSLIFSSSWFSCFFSVSFLFSILFYSFCYVFSFSNSIVQFTLLLIHLHFFSLPLVSFWADPFLSHIWFLNSQFEPLPLFQYFLYPLFNRHFQVLLGAVCKILLFVGCNPHFTSSVTWVMPRFSLLLKTRYLFSQNLISQLRLAQSWLFTKSSMHSVLRSSALINRTMLNCPAFRPNISIRYKLITFSSVYLPTVITIINAWVPGASNVMHFTMASE